MTDEVAELVLEDNRAQTLALTIARRQAGPMVDVHARYLRSLEVEGLLNRALEFLPSEKQLSERASAGLGLTTPEFAVLLAYTKETNTVDVLALRPPRRSVRPARARALLPERRSASASPTPCAATGCGGRSSPPC